MMHPCAAPGCGQLVPRGQSRCPSHKRQGQQAYDRARGTAAERGYDAAHRNWRAQILARDPICRACGRAPSTFADHVTPLSRGGQKLDLANGQGLCARCHQSKRGRERHGL